MNPYVIDAFEFSRMGEQREGQIKVADLMRLSAECVDSTGMIEWSLHGGRGAHGHLSLTLSVSGAVQLVCQRCLENFSLPIQLASILVLAKDEANADAIEEALDDDAIDAIVGSATMNVFDLIEDEVLLTLPFSARHEVCPDSSALDAAKNEKVSPFAVLKGINR